MKLCRNLTLAALVLAVVACSANDGGPEETANQGDAAASLKTVSGRGETSPPEEGATSRPIDETEEETPMSSPGKSTAYFGAGCFWCVEAVYEQLDGVLDVKSGYMGGQTDDPTYKEVCSGTTGHAEIVRVDFDPAKISFETLLDWFWRLHDPTTLNRQGNDIGTQYRSAIFYVDAGQRAAAESSKKAQEEAGTFDDPIVTEITEASKFYEAEEYHDDYYRLNKTQGYCRVVIRPKLKKLGLKN